MWVPGCGSDRACDRHQMSLHSPRNTWSTVDVAGVKEREYYESQMVDETKRSIVVIRVR